LGTRNWQLIRDCEHARKAGRAEEHARLVELVEESQQKCPHPKDHIQIKTQTEDVETKNRGLIKRGDQVMYCLACSRFIRHYPKTA
jgi:hypothetical protein